MECIKFEINKSIEINELLSIWISITTGKHGSEREGTGGIQNFVDGNGTGRD